MNTHPLCHVDMQDGFLLSQLNGHWTGISILIETCPWTAEEKVEMVAEWCLPSNLHGSSTNQCYLCTTGIKSQEDQDRLSYMTTVSWVATKVDATWTNCAGWDTLGQPYSQGYTATSLQADKGETKTALLPPRTYKFWKEPLLCIDRHAQISRLLLRLEVGFFQLITSKISMGSFQNQCNLSCIKSLAKEFKYHHLNW